MTFKHQSKKPYPGLSSTTEDSSDSQSDWTDDADDADDGRSIIGTDPWAQESVTGVTGSKKHEVLKNTVLQFTSNSRLIKGGA